MAHFAQLDANNKVIDVVVIDNSDMLDPEGNESEILGIAFLQNLFGSATQWKQYSYNANFRKNGAHKGCTYDEERDAFIHIQPYPSWVLNEDTCRWESPVAMPDDGNSYGWDEDSQTWIQTTET